MTQKFIQIFNLCTMLMEQFTAIPDGTIYINPDFVNTNTAIHEFSHLWEQLMPTTWKKGVDIFKQTAVGKKIYNQLKNEGNYSNLTDNELWSEALNHSYW